MIRTHKHFALLFITHMFCANQVLFGALTNAMATICVWANCSTTAMCLTKRKLLERAGRTAFKAAWRWVRATKLAHVCVTTVRPFVAACACDEPLTTTWTRPGKLLHENFFFQMIKEVLEYSKTLSSNLERVNYAMNVMEGLLEFACMERVPQEIRSVIATFCAEDYTFLIDGKRVRFETECQGCTAGLGYDVRTSYDGGKTWSNPMDIYLLKKDIQTSPLWQSLEFRFAWTMVDCVGAIFRSE